MPRGAGTAVLGGVEHVVSGWAAYEIERRDARWEATGKPPGVYGGRAYVYAEDVVESLPRPNALQKAALRLSSSLRRFEDRACEPNEDGLWECVPLSQPAAGYFATPPVTSADLQEFAASPAQQKDPALLELMSRDLSQLAAEEHEPLSDMPVLPQRMASPADRRSIRGLEVSVLPFAAALELRQARLATQMSRAADLVDGQLDTGAAAEPGATPGPPALKVFVGNKVHDAAKLVALAKKNPRLEVTNHVAEADLVIAAKPDASVQPGAWRSAFPEARRLTDKLKLPFTVREWCADSQVAVNKSRVAVNKSRVAVDDVIPETQVVTTRSAVKQVVELFAHSAEHLPRLIVKTDLKNEKCSIQVVANGHLEEALGSLPAVVQEFVEGAQSIKVHVGLALDGRFVWFREAVPEKVETFLRERAAPLFKWALDVPGCFQRFELDLVVGEKVLIVDVHANPSNPQPELLRFIYMLAGVEEVSPAFGVA